MRDRILSSLFPLMLLTFELCSSKKQRRFAIIMPQVNQNKMSHISVTSRIKSSFCLWLSQSADTVMSKTQLHEVK